MYGIGTAFGSTVRGDIFMLRYCFAALVTSALAAPAAAQVFAGPYIGGHVGYASGSTDVDASLGGNWATEPPAFASAVESGLDAELDPNGLTYGIQVGFNAMAAPNFLLGIEASFTGMDADDDDGEVFTVAPVEYAAANAIDVKSTFALKGRAGVTSGNTLFYGSLGWAWVRARYEAALISDGGYLKAGSESKTTNGWLIGAGIEHKFAPNISGFLDYSYTDQGKVTVDSEYLPGSTFLSPPYTERYRHDLDLHQVKIGVNFSF